MVLDADELGEGSRVAKEPTHGVSDLLTSFLTACGGATGERGGEHVFRCPCRDAHTNGDAHPSGNARLGEDGRLLVTCRAGCSTPDIVAAIGWTMADLMPPNNHGARTRMATKVKQIFASIDDVAAAAGRWKKGKVEATHIYRDADGKPVVAVIRVRQPDGGKEMPQARPVDGGWVFGGIGDDRPLYDLPDLLKADPQLPVLFFEGEQKADLAQMLGFIATSASQGAGKAKHSDFTPLAGRVVHLFPDNNSVGAKHMQDVAERAYAAGAVTVTIVTLNDLPPKGDIVDYYNARRDDDATDDQIADEIRDAISNAVEVPHPCAGEDDGDDDGDGDGDDDPQSTDAPESPAGGENVADQLVALASTAELFHDENNEPYASLPVGSHTETCRIGSQHFSRWLAHTYYRATKSAVPSQAMATAVAQLSAKALFEGQNQSVHVRIARADGAIWIDLGNSEWQAVKITSSGWSVVDNPPARFVRGTGMRALPMPVAGTGSLDALFDVLQIGDRENRILLSAWLVNSLLPLPSYATLAVTGEQGSGKSTLCRVLQRLVDPHVVEGRSPPRNEEDIAVAAQHAHVLVYENVSSISAALSDSLCRVATGAGFAGRKLFTNDEERQLVFCRPVIINGIGDLATRSDLADRVVCVHLEPIARERRQTEGALKSKLDESMPKLFGTLLDLLSKVLATPDLDVPLERMAEYTQVGAKVAIALGLSAEAFLDAYRRNRDESSYSALESSAIGPVIMRMVRKQRAHQPIKSLLFDLNAAADQHEARHPEWPRTPKGLGNDLRRLAPNFARIGISVVFPSRRSDGRWVTIEEVANNVHNVHDVHRGGASR